MILEAGTVEGDLSYTGGLGTLSNQKTHLFSGFAVACSATAQACVKGGGTGQNLGAVGRDHLCVHVLRRTVHAQTYGFQLAHFQTRTTSSTETNNFFIAHFLCPTSSWLLYDARPHRRSEHPCPYRVRDDGNHEFPRLPDRPVACRCL